MAQAGQYTGVQPEEGLMEGGCLCGAVRYQIAAAPLLVANCHCSMCRRQSGAAYLTYAAFPRNSVVFSLNPKIYRSSTEAERGHCGNCGSPLTFIFDAEPGTIWIATGSLDQPDLLPPREDWYAADKLSWVKLADGVRQWPGPPG